METFNKKQPFVKGSNGALLHQQNILMNRLVWFVGIIMVFLIGLSIAQLVLLANLHASGAMVARTTESTVGMREDMGALQKRVETWMGDMPAQKVAGIVNNLHELSTNLARVTPAQLEGILRNAKDITERVSQSRDLFVRTGELFSSLTPALITRFMSSASVLAEYASELGKEAYDNNVTARASEALETLRGIGQRLERLHELTIKI